MANVALVEKTSSRTDYIRHFENKFEFDRFQLCSDKTKKTVSYTHLTLPTILLL